MTNDNATTQNKTTPVAATTATRRDLRDTPLYREAEAIYSAARQPGTGQISDALELQASPDGRHAVFAGVLIDKLEGLPSSRVVEMDLASADTRVLTFGPNTDRMPRYAPNGTQIAFLSDRHRRDDFQLYLLDRASGAARATPPVTGWVEYLHWSPDGSRILLGVAGHGADVAGGQGAVATRPVDAAGAADGWLPTVSSGDDSHRWRRLWIYELASHHVTPVSLDINVWDSAWCGNAALVAVVSPTPDEGAWYEATVRRIDLGTARSATPAPSPSTSRELFKPKHQLGAPAASPSGRHVAVIEAIASDRGIIAGELRIIDTHTGSVEPLETGAIDITYVEWRSDESLLIAGHRGFETVIAIADLDAGQLREVWSSTDLSTPGIYASASGVGVTGDCVLVGEGFFKAPEIAVIRAGVYHPVKSLNLDHSSAQILETQPAAAVERIRWPAPDGRPIEGWLLRPATSRPHPLVVMVHGGPVWNYHPRWVGRGALQVMLLRRGYALFMPNPRGSAGYGAEFIRPVIGDWGGADAQDILSGIDHLVERGIADPQRLGVTGQSYGGFMTAWLITQDHRFKAAATISPHTNQVTEHLLSNIPHFVRLFLADDYRNPTGKYFERSPVFHAHKARTPTLNICGALDRCTPPAEAIQFHNALLENQVESVLITYPQEGHGVRSFPTVMDYAARMVDWFERHLKAKR